MTDKDDGIHLPFGLTQKKITALVAAGVIFAVIAYYFKDDINTAFATRQENASAVARSKANGDEIKKLIAEYRSVRAEVNGRMTQMENVTSQRITELQSSLNNRVTLAETDIASLQQSRDQAKIERDKNTEFAANQPARGQRRTERLDAHRRDINRNENNIDKIKDQHSIPGKHPVPRH